MNLKLTYKKSSIYPDYSIIDWRINGLNGYHEGFWRDKIIFRILTDDVNNRPNSRCIMEYDCQKHEWQLVSQRFYETTLWNKFFYVDKEYAEKHNHYHSLHACYLVAENLIYQRISEGKCEISFVEK